MQTFRSRSGQSTNGQADQTAAYLDEIHQLRQRVVVLEAALAAAEARCDLVPDEAINPAVPSSEFSTVTEPAVQSATAIEPEVHVTTPSFADAWEEEDTSFEERFAERAFFHASSVDEASRNWLLDT